MKIAVCDDEKYFIDSLVSRIKKLFHDADLQITEFSCGEDILRAYESGHRFDVIFLDIEMGTLNGMQTAEEIRLQDQDVILVFLTSHTEFAIQGYSVNAFSYILKGQPEELIITQLQSVFHAYLQKYQYIFLTQGDDLEKVYIRDIMYFEVFKRVIVLHTVNTEYKYYGRLAELENDEKFMHFIKSNRSFFVNPEYIQRITKQDIILHNKAKVPISRQLYQKVFDAFSDYYVGR